MQARADALPQALERTGGPRQAAARSTEDRRQNRCGISEFDKREIGRGTSSPYNHSGTVVVASAWLAFYLIVAIHGWMASTH